MNTNQKRIWTLAKEVMDICDVAGIRCFVSGRSAMRAFKGNLFYKSFLDFNITISITDIVKFVDAFNKLNRINRQLEFVFSDYPYENFFVKYVDEDTTLVRINEENTTRYKGMFICIQLLKYKPENENIENKKKYHYLTTMLYKYGTASSRKKIEKQLLNNVIEIYGNRKSEKSILNNIWGSCITTDIDIWNNLKICEFEKRSYFIPDYPYCEMISDSNWEKYLDEIILEGNAATMIVEGANNIVSIEYSYGFLMPYLRKAGLNKKFYRKRRRNIDSNIVNKELSEDAKYAWNIAQRAGDLWKIKDYYDAKREKIEQLYKNQEWFELKKILGKYDETVRKYIDIEIMFLYDERIFSIYKQVLEIFHEEKTLQAIKKLGGECA